MISRTVPSSRGRPGHGDLGEIDQRDLGKPLFQLGQAGVDEALSLLGRMEFRIFPKISVGAGLQDLFRQFVAQLVFERRYLFLQLSL